jgi:hypothetical protein
MAFIAPPLNRFDWLTSRRVAAILLIFTSVHHRINEQPRGPAANFFANAPVSAHYGFNWKPCFSPLEQWIVSQPTKI